MKNIFQEIDKEVDLYVGVPDSLLKDFIIEIDKTISNVELGLYDHLTNKFYYKSNGKEQ